MDNEIIPFISKFWLNIQTFVIPFDSVLVLVKNNYLKVLVRFQILIKDFNKKLDTIQGLWYNPCIEIKYEQRGEIK